MAATMWGTMPSVQPKAANNPRREPPPMELDTVYTTPVPGIRTTTSDVSKNSTDMRGRLFAPDEPVKPPAYPPVPRSPGDLLPHPSCRGKPPEPLRGAHGAHHGPRQYPRPPRPDHVGRRRHPAGGSGEDDVPVDRGVDGVHGAGEAVVGHLRNLDGLGFREPGVGRHDAQSGVLPPPEIRGRLRQQGRRVAQRAIIAARACDRLPRLRVPDVAEGIDGGDGRDDEAFLGLRGGAADAALHSPVKAEYLPDAGTGPGPDAPLLEVPGGGGGRGLVAHRGVWTRPWVPHHDIEEDRRRDERDAGDADVQADAPLLQEADDAVGGGEAEGAAAGQQEAVGAPDGPDRAEAVRLAGPWRGAAHVDAHHGAVGTVEEDGGEAGEAVAVGGVTHEHAWHVAQIVPHGFSLSRLLPRPPARHHPRRRRARGGPSPPGRRAPRRGCRGRARRGGLPPARSAWARPAR